MAAPEGNHLHFIGIGGIGMSGIAAIFRQQGYTISGCDTDTNQKSIGLLRSLGCTITEGNGGPACSDPTITAVVRTSAVKEDHPEVIAARKRGIPVLHRAELLATLTKQRPTIAVSGAHGKTTTTALIGHLLTTAMHDPTIIVGGFMQNLGTNFRAGNGPFFVVEADESDRSFLLLSPLIAVITNIDLEHLDTYRDKEDVKETFKKFIEKLPPYGHAIVNLDDPFSHELIKTLPDSLKAEVITCGTAAEADTRLVSYSLEADCSHATVRLPHGGLVSFVLPLPGKHNLYNALSACAVASILQIPPFVIQQALESFQGVEQRFTHRGTFPGASVFDDYAHHPAEIASALAVAKKKNKGALHVVFQPHRFTRTQKLWDQFVEILADPAIDELILVPIYPASEPPIEGITSEKLVEAIHAQRSGNKVRLLPLEKDYQSLITALKQTVKKDDLVLFLGAGKVNRLAAQLAEISET